MAATRSPLTAHLDSTPLYVLKRGKVNHPYATTWQLHRLLERDWQSGGAVLSDQERTEIAAIIERNQS